MDIQHHFTDGELRRLYADHPIIGLAEQALRAFYITSRADAAKVLPLWRHYPELSPREVAAVLARFDDPPAGGREDPETGGPLPPDVEGFPVGGHDRT